jgi:hypothetical protein
MLITKIYFFAFFFVSNIKCHYVAFCKQADALRGFIWQSSRKLPRLPSFWLGHPQGSGENKLAQTAKKIDALRHPRELLP